MRALLTGTGGHLGSFVARELVRRGHAVAALARPASSLARVEDIVRAITVIRGDLDSAAVVEGVHAFAPEVVVHLGWSSITREARDSAEQIHTNVGYTLTLFRMAQEAGMQTWVGIGSQAEYGPAGVPLHEALPLRPDTAYGTAKVAVAMLTEKLAELASIRFAWLRLLATYGPDDDDRHLIPMLIRNFLAGSTPQLTSGRQLVDYLFVSDAAEAIAIVAENAVVNGVFNLASGAAVTVRSIAEAVRDIVAPTSNIDFAPAEPRGIPDLGADVSRLRSVTGWNPRVSLHDGLVRTARWYAEHATRAKPF